MSKKINTFICLLVIFSTISIVCFEVHHADHAPEHCTEENCPICYVLRIVKNNISLSPLKIAIKSLYAWTIGDIVIAFSSIYTIFDTLVRQKTKLTI